MASEHKLKVFGGLIFTGARGQLRTIVATTSRAKVAALTGETVSSLYNYWSITGNPEECDIALRHPGKVFQEVKRDSRIFHRVELDGHTLRPVPEGIYESYVKRKIAEDMKPFYEAFEKPTPEDTEANALRYLYLKEHLALVLLKHLPNTTPWIDARDVLDAAVDKARKTA